MLDLIDITKSYPSRLGRRTIFRDFNLSIPDGCNAGLIGPNGAGKSTLMRLLGGLEHLDGGRIVTDRRISWPIGLAGGMQGSLTGRDNVRFVCRIHAATHEEMREKIAFVRAFADIGDAFDMPVKTYSSGMRSRLTFGLAMAFDFDLYLIDEVTAVGDAVFRRKSQEMLRERLRRAQVIYTSHNMGEIARMCNAVVLLRPAQPPQFFEDVQAGIAAYQQMSPAARVASAPVEACPA
ncbi:ABC transporter ATP-binding protein [Sphaerotilus sp.]|uniref:ABC transporter ATP-binding protein n=1 Tax=Sphaerotilus sp. TaxID=2093942 RepID=UPI002ACDB433|nr:ABC transporter ATP-binding protein [Sphaerotilus sp.]MDZ7855362.1 ABC transporter ATP-binding protein [Sphaerotilus sp.]